MSVKTHVHFLCTFVIKQALKFSEDPRSGLLTHTHTHTHTNTHTDTERKREVN